MTRHVCRVCTLVFPSISSLQRHQGSASHKARLGVSTLYLTPPPDVRLTSLHIPAETWQYVDAWDDEEVVAEPQGDLEQLGEECDATNNDTANDQQSHDISSLIPNLGASWWFDAASSIRSTQTVGSSPWFPFRDAQECCFWIMLHSHKYTVSQAHGRFLRGLMREMGMAVPSVTLTRSRADTELPLVRPNVLDHAIQGPAAAIRSVRDLVASHLAQPDVARAVRPYYDDSALIKLPWQSQLWAECCTASAALSHLPGRPRLYTGDRITTLTGTSGAVTSFFTRNDDLWCRYLPLHSREPTAETLVTQIATFLPEPSALREKVGPHRHLDVGIAVFSDETSGNTSKRYNLFENLFYTLCTVDLPPDQWPTGLIACAKGWSALELLEHVANDVAAGAEGFWAYDGFANSPVFVRVRLLACLAHNPRANQLCPVMQCTTTFFFRYCYVPRTSSLRVMPPRTKQLSTHQLSEIADGNLTSAQCGLAVGRTPLFRIPGFDPHKSLPLELLHLLPLGIVKYVATLSKSDLFGKMTSDARLRLAQLFDRAPAFPGHRVGGERIMRWVGFMIGKDFRYMARTVAMVLAGLVPSRWVELWFWAGQVLALACVHEIARSKMDQYCAALDRAVQMFLVASQAIPEAKYLGTLKCHLLLHLSTHVRRFGPLRLWMTERFGSFNGNVRRQIQRTNRQEPSRDVAMHFAASEAGAHMAGGGTWLLNGVRVVAGEEAQRTLHQHLLGAMVSDGGERSGNHAVLQTQRGQRATAGSFVAYLDGGRYCFMQVQSVSGQTCQGRLYDGEEVPQQRVSLKLRPVNTQVAVNCSDVLELLDVWHDCESAGCSIQQRLSGQHLQPELLRLNICQVYQWSQWSCT